jgi:hypothetical protein
MGIPSASYSITVRVHLGADPLGIGRITTAVGESAGTVVAVDIVESHSDLLVVDLTCNAVDARHADAITRAVGAIEGAEVHTVSDRTFLLHLGGKLEVASMVPLRTRDDLSMAYTPGVARVCRAIAANPADARKLTIKRNTVAVVTDGSAVLGLGNIGPEAALPVMEGKAVLFKQFAGVDAWPVCLATQDTDEIVRTVELLAPGYGGVNLEDIAAPRCFEVERRLRESLDIPVFHDDQHGTAIVVLAALTNALRVVGKDLAGVRLVLSGSGAAGVAIIKILQAEGRARSSPATAPASSTRAARGWTRASAGWPSTPTPTASPAACATPWPARTCSSGSAAPASSSRPTSPPWPARRSCSPWPTPTPRSTRPGPVVTPPWSPPAAATSPTRSTTCSPSRGCSGAPWTPAPGPSPRR